MNLTEILKSKQDELQNALCNTKEQQELFKVHQVRIEGALIVINEVLEKIKETDEPIEVSPKKRSK
jgi:hypothetical protein